MNMNMATAIRLIACSLLLGASVANAVTITSGVSYEYLNGESPDSGAFAYLDETGNQLINGRHGQASWYPTPRNFEWVGFRRANNLIQIEFTFDRAYSFNQVNVFTLQSSATEYVWAPKMRIATRTLGGTYENSITWTRPTDLTPGAVNVPFMLNGVEAQQILVTLEHNNLWAFLDEVTFEGSIVPPQILTRTTNRVPDSGSTLALFGMAIMGVGMFRRKLA